MKKNDIATELKRITDDFLNYVETEFPDCASYFRDEASEKVYELLNVEKPKVMVYGIYNSGKSTLINALCKEEVAETADRPMTYQVTEFDHGDYFLIDSPGVDAPIEHERVTEEFLNKCHIILFVISSKGIFEDRDNYKRLAALIEKEIPFIIVLNERGYESKREWTPEQREEAKEQHEKELKEIQYKIIQNLKAESKDENIAEKYEVVILNAKKSLKGALENKPKLYESGRVEKLDKRIGQILQNDATINELFKQPVVNLKDSFNQIEKMVTQEMSGNTSEDFGTGIDTLQKKKDNIWEDLKILTKQSVMSQLDGLAAAYASGDASIFETIAYSIYGDVEQRFDSKIHELYAYADKRFKDLNIYLDTTTNLSFDTVNIQFGNEAVSAFVNGNEDTENSPHLSPEKKKFFDFLKSRKKKEKEKAMRLEQEARMQNEYAKKQVYEQIRIRQEARQAVESDLMDLLNCLNTIVSNGLQQKVDEIISQIQEVDCLNKKKLEDGKRQMEEIKKFRGRVMEIENRMIGIKEVS